MNKIEVTPKSLITARLNFAQELGMSGSETSGKLIAPQLPDYYPSISTLFYDESFWSEVDGTDYVPRALIELVLYRKEQAVNEKRPTFSVFIDEMVRTSWERHGIKSAIVTPKQRFQFWERDLAETVVAIIEESTNSTDYKRNKIGYGIRQVVEKDEFNWLYTQLLSELVHAYTIPVKQAFLSNYQ
jgi:hypothetical protein